MGLSKRPVGKDGGTVRSTFPHKDRMESHQSRIAKAVLSSDIPTGSKPERGVSRKSITRDPGFSGRSNESGREYRGVDL